jgi:hypothetical protein
MHVEIKKLTKNNSQRKEEIVGKNTSFGAGYGAEFWWKLHFNGTDKNGLRTDIEVTLTEKERVKFIKEFETQVMEFKKYIKNKGDE